MVESSARVAPWREAVKWAAMKAWGHKAPMDGPLVAIMAFTLPKPKSCPKTRRTWPDRTPDGSKLMRSTEDALTDAGVWADDARVVLGVFVKRYPLEGTDAMETPGAVIRIFSATDPMIAQELARIAA